MNVELLSNLYTGLYLILSGLLIAMIIYRVVNCTSGSDRKKWSSLPKYLKVLKILLGISAICILIGLPFEAWIASGVKMITPFYARALLYGSLGVLMILELLKITSVSDKTVSKNFRQIFMSVYIFILIWQGFNFMKSAISTFTYPDVADCELIDWPVKDTWFVGHGGGTEHLNYHFVADQQSYAIDILKIGENGSYYENRGGEITDFFTFNEPVYAPVNGKVVKVVDTLPNEDITFAPNNHENPAGNYIVIQYDTNRWLFLAHLNKGKVRVEKGDKVISGDLIGFAGNSGNTSWPHLHLHIQNQPELNSSGAKGIPFRFKMAEVKRWFDFERQSDFYPLRNDLIKPLR